MHSFLVAIVWGADALITLGISALAIILALLALRPWNLGGRKVRPFRRFRLVNKSNTSVTTATVEGLDTLPTNLLPLAPNDSRAIHLLDSELDRIDMLTLHVTNSADAAASLPIGTEGSYLDTVVVELSAPPAALPASIFSYKLTVVRYIDNVLVETTETQGTI